LLRDRDRVFGREFVEQVRAMVIKQVLSAPRSPWQRAYVEHVIGTIRRECLDHVIIFGERDLRRWLRVFIDTTIEAVPICRSAKTLRNRDRFRTAARDV
jgi:putative transposase